MARNEDKQTNSSNRMNMQKSVIFVEKNFKIDMLKIKNIKKLVINVIIQANIEVLHITYVI